MSEDPKTGDILAIDFGNKRIGIARAGRIAKLPEALKTIEVDGNELEAIKNLVSEYSVGTIVVGWPRNLRGEDTEQTARVSDFIERLKEINCTIVRQDEALSSVDAEAELKRSRRKFVKADIDARAAVIILENYLKENL